MIDGEREECVSLAGAEMNSVTESAERRKAERSVSGGAHLHTGVGI